MWLLIAIVLVAGQVDSVRVLETYIKKQACLDRAEQAFKQGIPLGLTLNCVPLNGVKQTNAKELRQRIS